MCYYPVLSGGDLTSIDRDRFVYPALRKFNIPFRPVSRITLGFVTMGGAVAFAAVGQSCEQLTIIQTNMMDPY